METLRIKHRDFQIIEKLDEGVYKCSFKNKDYVATRYEPGTSFSDELLFNLERISNSGVSCPKLRWVDKKAGYYVRDYVEGQNMLSFLGEKDIDDKYLQDLFNNAYLAKIKGLSLDYSPDKWILVDDKLCYNDSFCARYDDRNDLVKAYLRLWFPTTEMEQYCRKNGISIDKSRSKDQYAVNKQIVLMVCKYYK